MQQPVPVRKRTLV